MPKVSIIIPLYNKAPYIRKALETVYAQTYQDWECIIMDDGSTDGSKQIAERWIEEDSCRCGCRFRLLSQPNAGVSAARNNAVALAKGELISFLDADDWWESSFLEEMVSFTERTPEAGIWASNYIYYKPGKTRVGVTNISYTDREKGLINYPRSYFEGTGMPITSISMIMRRSVFEELGGFPLGIRLGEDFLLWAKIALRYPVAFLDEPLAYYNNDIPPSLRATRNLHAPEHHMLFLMSDVEQKSRNLEEALRADWQRLFDRLRVNGLLDYWLDSRYHDAVAAELRKVDWSAQPKVTRTLYRTPLRILRMRRKLMEFGSYCKQKLLKILIRK